MSRGDDDRGAAADLRAMLRPNEALVWAARPRPLSYARANIKDSIAGVKICLFGLIFSALSWGGPGRGADASGDVVGNAMSTPFVVIGLVVAVIGLVAIPSAPLALVRTGRIAFGVTSQRLIVRGGLLSRRHVSSHELSRIVMIERHDRGDGVGDLLFWAEEETKPGTKDLRPVADGFAAIDNVRQVEAAVLRLLERQACATPSGRHADVPLPAAPQAWRAGTDPRSG